MKKYILFYLLFLFIFFSCQHESVLPENIKIEKIKSLYIGIFETEVFTFNKNSELNVDLIKNYPKYNDIFDDNLKVYKWNLIEFNSKIFETLLSDLSNETEFTKNGEEWDESLLLKLRKEPKSFLISGVYNKSLNETGNLFYFYHYYLLDLKDNKLIKIFRVNDF